MPARQKLLNRLTTVRKLIFAFFAQAGRGATFTRYKKQRIIAKAIMPFRRCQNTAFPAALEYLWCWVGGMTHIHQYALETGCTLRFRHVFKRRQQLGIIGTVALAKAIIRSGIAGAVNSGRALQGINFKTGIIGQCRQTGGSAGIRALRMAFSTKLRPVSSASITLS